jgi:hypothetical protein
MPIGSLIAGALADYLGGPWAVTIMGATCFLIAVGMSFAVPDLWNSRLIPAGGKAV